GRVDLVIAGAAGLHLALQSEPGRFTDPAGTGLPQGTTAFVSIALADLDHDGDLDIVAAGETVAVLRNNGNGTFTDITSAAGFATRLDGAIGAGAVDFDNRRD